MVTHVLKTWLVPFDAIWRGDKWAEFRPNDRDFQPGDELELMEFDERAGKLKARSILARVTHVIAGPAFGIPDGYAMLSIAPYQGRDAGGIAWTFENGIRLQLAAVTVERAALRERVKLLKDALLDAGVDIRCWLQLARYQCEKMDNNLGWCPTQAGIKQSERVLGTMADALKDQPPASPAEPDPTPLRTCLESLAQLGVEAQYLNRAGDNEALRAMAGRLKQVEGA